MLCCVYNREEYIKQLHTAIEMLLALRKTVANPGIDALFEIGWTIQSSYWDQTRAQWTLGEGRPYIREEGSGLALWLQDRGVPGVAWSRHRALK